MMRSKYIPGHGDSCPYTLPKSTMPLARLTNLVKSNGGSSNPGTVNSGKTHSVTGCTYKPARILFFVVTEPVITWCCQGHTENYKYESLLL